MTLFETTMLPHMDAAYNLARWLTGNDADAQDITQEAYVRGLKYFHGFAGGDGKAWLLTIVRNTFFTWRSRQKKEPLVFDEQLHGTESSESNPEDAALRSSSLQSLRECMEALPVEYRETLVMRELEELSYQTIAEIASIPIGTVMSRLSRARKRLTDCMAAKGRKS